MHDEEQEDPRLTRLLQAVRADADPALWTRVRARIADRPRVPRFLEWAMRPAALAASMALFLASMAGALVLATQSSVASEDYATLTEALVAERDADAAIAPAVSTPEVGAAQDSGSGR
ncbi:MAG TPA: hypothetical protein VJY35_12615 [Candidatus Eisenbacteria bacterium]|nr:hypothetical protein [Candidatus Eisenbacteria bacterium]